MLEQIQWARLADPANAVRSLEWPECTYMYLERAPDAWLSDEEALAGIRLELLDLKEHFEQWERARVFCNDFELRWEKLDGAFQAVLVGQAPLLADFAVATDLDLESALKQMEGYSLWGARVANDQLPVIAAEHALNSQVFLELRIPRILYYPVSPQARHVQLNILEYYDPKSGNLLYYRCVGLEELP